DSPAKASLNDFSVIFFMTFLLCLVLFFNDSIHVTIRLTKNLPRRRRARRGKNNKIKFICYKSL
ncbi:hypothetical protein B6D60_09125, partial [candidate division KSB1 bacterium 4484_87]